MTEKKTALRPEIRAAIDAAHDKQALDVTLLDLEGLGAFTSYFIICTGLSTPQVDAICDEIERKLAPLGTRLIHREGRPGAEWMLLDFGGLVVHVFTEAARQYYDIERLWRAARRVDFGEPGNRGAMSDRAGHGVAEAEG